MFAVHVNKTWPLVEQKRMTPADAVLGRWPISDEKIGEFGDVVLGVFENVVVAAYDITGHSRDAENKVIFTGTPSTTWAHLIGQPTPAAPWGRRGDAWPVRTVATSVVAGGDVPVEDTPAGRRAVVDGVVLTVDDDRHVTVILPAGRAITVQYATT
ncbi:hypothetical protein [Polymorphospora sp. NPDC050346]|uniref:hypothetical protein n=1 Tax=Polymorphospora sp. NPDC050346 TaxID=3155780 RepID=UPI0033D24C8A